VPYCEEFRSLNSLLHKTTKSSIKSTGNQPVPYVGDNKWVESALIGVKSCLMNDAIPDAHENCEICGYTSARMRCEGASGNRTESSDGQTSASIVRTDT
jgi:hypothetical protein